jgi:antitoxin (DNA-binding transcriptional repressor) of toxin-antitoxin stability system
MTYIAAYFELWIARNIMASLTVSASEARANFSKLGEEIARTGESVTVFKNSKPWLTISPAGRQSDNGTAVTRSHGTTASTLTAEEQELLAWAETFAEEYHDVFEALAK